MRKLCLFLLKLFGWHYEISVEIPDKCVFCVAPHTSNWDYVIGILFYQSVIGGNPHVLMKKELFFFPVHWLFKSLGGIPVDRKKKTKTSVSDQMVELFRSNKRFHLAVSPEGTRKRNDRWKTGFYYIALNSGVPIVQASIDYSKKEVGVKKIFYPTGDANSDIEEIKSYYQNVGAKYPGKFAIK